MMLSSEGQKSGHCLAVCWFVMWWTSKTQAIY